MTKKPKFKHAAPLVVKHYGTHLKVAQALGYKDLRNVSAWVNGKRPFQPHHCVKIEQDTYGAITRKMLRPEDWESLWPELVYV